MSRRGHRQGPIEREMRRDVGDDIAGVPLERNRYFQAHRDKRIGRSACFLCGVRITKRNSSDEHVLPKWVLNRFDLWDTKLRLLNGTFLPYRRMTIPCCKTCNGTHLSRIEEQVRTAVTQGFEAVDALDPQVLFLWLGKIFYGILHKEHLLVHDRRDPKSPRIVPRAVLEGRKTHHGFLQAARTPITWMTPIPATILVVPLQSPRAVDEQFDMRDLLFPMTISLRLGNVGIIAALQDGGAQRDTFAHLMERYRQHPMHPHQFVELTTKFFYKATLLRQTPSFMWAGNEHHLAVRQLPWAWGSERLFDSWDNRIFASMLALHMGVERDLVINDQDELYTLLGDDENGMPHIPL